MTIRARADNRALYGPAISDIAFHRKTK